MICPYCTAEIEPIELNGKTFCSNCGLAINQPQIAQHDTPHIIPLSNPSAAAPKDTTTATKGDSCQVTAGSHAIKRIEPTISELLTPKTGVSINHTDEKADKNEETSKSEKSDEAEHSVEQQTLTTPLSFEEQVIAKLSDKQSTPDKFEGVSEDNKDEAINSLKSPIKDSTLAELNPEENKITEELPKEEAPKTEAVEQVKEPEKVAEKPVNEDVAIKQAVPDEKPKKTPKVLMDLLNDDTTEIRTMSGEELKPLINEGFENKVKGIETLGASGILLDILSDEAVQHSREANIEALESASDLVEKVVPAKMDDKTDKKTNIVAQTFKPKGAVKVAINVLDKSPANPITHPEIEAAPAELDLPLLEPVPDKAENEAEEIDSFEANESMLQNVIPNETPIIEPDPNEVSLPQTENEEEKVEDSIPNVEQVLAQETQGEETSETKEFIAPTLNADEISQLDEKVQEVFGKDSTGDIDLSDLPSIKKERKNSGKKNSAHVLNIEDEKEKEEAGETLATEEATEETERVSEQGEQVEETEIKAFSRPKVGLAADKSQHLTNYFSQIITNKEGSVTKSKKVDKKPKKKKKQKSYKYLYILLFALAFFAIGALAYFYFFLPTGKTSTNQYQTTVTNDYSSSLPKEIPIGYKLTNKVDYNSDSQTLTAIYEFSNDATRQIIFNKQKTDSGKEIIEQGRNTIDTKFEVKSSDDVEYTIFANGSIIWTKNGYYYSLIVKGETYKDLVIKMATSTE